MSIEDKIEVGSKVAFNRQKDAEWFVVKAKNAFTLYVVEEGKENSPEKIIDIDFVKQVRN